VCSSDLWLLTRVMSTRTASLRQPGLSCLRCCTRQGMICRPDREEGMWAASCGLVAWHALRKHSTVPSHARKSKSATVTAAAHLPLRCVLAEALHIAAARLCQAQVTPAVYGSRSVGRQTKLANGCSLEGRARIACRLHIGSRCMPQAAGAHLQANFYSLEGAGAHVAVALHLLFPP